MSIKDRQAGQPEQQQQRTSYRALGKIRVIKEGSKVPRAIESYYENDSLEIIIGDYYKYNRHITFVGKTSKYKYLQSAMVWCSIVGLVNLLWE